MCASGKGKLPTYYQDKNNTTESEDTMATLPQQDTIKEYISDGITVQYAITFYVAPLAAGMTTYDINVYAQAPNVPVNPETQILVQGVDYTVNVPDPNPNFISGNYITLTVA